MTRGRIEKHRLEEKETNGEDEEGGVKGLSQGCSSCLIIEIIICNHLPQKVRAVSIQRDK